MALFFFHLSAYAALDPLFHREVPGVHEEWLAQTEAKAWLSIPVSEELMLQPERLKILTIKGGKVMRKMKNPLTNLSPSVPNV